MAAKHDDGDRDGPEEEGWQPPHHRRDPLLDGTGVGLVRASLPVVARHGRRVRYVGIDIECTGDDVLRHKIIAAGLAWVDLLPDEDALACAGAKLWTMDVPEDPESAFEPRCWEEFWSKQPEALRGIREHRAAALAVGGLPDDAAVWRDLRRTLDAVCLEAARDGAKVCLVSDNPAYDVGRANIELSRAADESSSPNSLLYLCKTPDDPGKRSYSSVRSTGTLQRLNKLGRLSPGYPVPGIPFEHDHLPQNDAMVIAWKYACADAALGLE